jgi:hypothetical protein
MPIKEDSSPFTVRASAHKTMSGAGTQPELKGGPSCSIPTCGHPASLKEPLGPTRTNVYLFKTIPLISEHTTPDSEMYTPDMMIDKGKPDLSRARLSTEQASALCAKSGGQSVQEPDQRQPTPVHSDDEELHQVECKEEIRKGRRPGCRLEKEVNDTCKS